MDVGASSLTSAAPIARDAPTLEGSTGKANASNTARAASEPRHLEKTTEHDHLFRISPRLSTTD